MYKTFILLSLSFLLACEANVPIENETTEVVAETPSAEEAKTAVEQLIRDAFDEIWSGLDTNAIARLHTSDFILLEHGEIWTNDTIMQYQRREAANVAEQGYVRLNDFDFLETVADGKTVWTAYHNYGTWKKDDEVLFEAQWLESAVAIHTEDGWKLKLLHSTRVQKDQ